VARRAHAGSALSNDRLFPAFFLRRVAQERLGITPDEIDGGHCPALSRPKELADHLEAYHAQTPDQVLETGFGGAGTTP
jgi:phenylalanine-4-hydroxylase